MARGPMRAAFSLLRVMYLIPLPGLEPGHAV